MYTGIIEGSVMSYIIILCVYMYYRGQYNIVCVYYRGQCNVVHICTCMCIYTCICIIEGSIIIIHVVCIIEGNMENVTHL